MEISNEKLKEYTRRIMFSRMRLLCDHGFYGLLLMHVKMNISNELDTAWIGDDDRLCFNPEFLENVSDKELDYVLMHLLMHIVLKHTTRATEFDSDVYDVAADIVVNSNIYYSCNDDPDSISLKNYGGLQPHLAPCNEEGWKYTVEEIYRMFAGQGQDNGKDKDDNSLAIIAMPGSAGGGWDYHNVSHNGQDGDNAQADNLSDLIWQGRIKQAAMTLENQNSSKNCGNIPALIERYLLDLQKPQIDWRTLLNDFVQEEIFDYSFSPPDKRFIDNSPFFLPDFNDTDFYVKDLLFMIDTSASMSDEEVSQCYGEVKSAIDQFGGKLQGWLGFFDAEVVEPVPFMDESEFKTIRPYGGGGTRFDIIFDYVNTHMNDEPPVGIVILTDGYAPFPEEEARENVPVLWIINNEKVNPPWGKVARILEE